METELKVPVIKPTSRKSRIIFYTLIFFASLFCLGCIFFLVAVFSVPDWMRPVYNYVQPLRSTLNIPYVDVRGKYSYVTQIYTSPDGSFTCKFEPLLAGAILQDKLINNGTQIILDRGYIFTYGVITIYQWHLSFPSDESESRVLLPQQTEDFRKSDPFYSNFKNQVITDEFLNQPPILYYWLVRGDTDLKSYMGAPVLASGGLSFYKKWNVYDILIDYAPIKVSPFQSPAPSGNDMKEFIKKLLFETYSSCNFIR